MFGAEIMNRQLRSQFEKTSKKAVLLPTCMRTPPKTGCKAISDGKELVCMQCNSFFLLFHKSAERRLSLHHYPKFINLDPTYNKV